MLFFFNSSRGVRQGDPLSPLLFILAQEIFSFNIKRAVADGSILPYSHGRGGIVISHLLYADDMLLFSKASKKAILALRRMVTNYEESSGQLINLEKKSGFLSRGSALAGSLISYRCGLVAHKNSPMRYLGIPLYTGRIKGQYFEDIEAKVRKKICGWKSSRLSFGGKFMLLKAVLASIPISSLAAMRVPQTVPLVGM